MTKFRFEDLEIWEIAIELADRLFDIADELERKKLYRFAGQLRGAGMSMSNNIAKGLVQDQTRCSFSIWNMPGTPPLKMQILQS